MTQNIEKTTTQKRYIYPVLIKFLKQKQWPHKPIPEKDSAYISFQGNNGNWACLAQCREDARQFIFYSVYHEAIPEYRRYPIAEFITMVNDSILFGNYTLNYDDGELKLKTMSLIERGTSPSVELIERTVNANLVIMDHFYQGIEKITGLDLSPLEAFEEIVEIDANDTLQF